MNPHAKPLIIGIGAQKSGTSWLFENLRQHPMVWAPPFKEVHFFDYKFCPDMKKWIPWHLRNNIKAAIEKIDGRNDQEEERAYLEMISDISNINGNWYKKVYSRIPDHCIGIDVTPEYSSIPLTGVNFARKFLPASATAFFLVRDPVDRAISQIKMHIRRRRLDELSAEAWQNLINLPEIEDRGAYRRNITNWELGFGRENISYFPFGQISNSPIDILRAVEKRFGLPNADYPHAHKPVFSSPHHDVPMDVRHSLRLKFEGEYNFLRAKFSDEFCALL